MRFLALTLALFCTYSFASCQEFLRDMSRAYYWIEAFDSHENFSRLISRDDLFEETSRLFYGESDDELKKLMALVNEIPALERGLTFDRILDKILVHEPTYQDQLVATDAVVSPTADVLDLGCGGGAFCTYLAYRSSARRFLMVDQDPAAVELAQRHMRHLRPKAEDRFLVRSAQNLTVAPRSMDALLLNHFLVYLPPQEKVALLRAGARMLKGKGVIVVHEPVPSPPRYRNPDEYFLRAYLPTAEAGRLSRGDLLTGFALFMGDLERGRESSRSLDTYPTDPTFLIREARDAGLEIVDDLSHRTFTYFRLVFRVPE